MLIGERLKKLRIERGLTQQELGDIINVTKATICCYEKETRTPTLENIIDIADFFEVETDYLLGRDLIVKNRLLNKNEFIKKEDLESFYKRKSDIKVCIEKLKEGILLEKKEINNVVRDFTNGLINDKDMGEFLLLIKEKDLSYEETFYLTDAMVKTGDILDLSKIKKTIVDKHSTGGVGDKVTFLVGPIVASLGLGVAKMSGRSLGFTGGTIDKLESIEGYKVNIKNEDFIRNVNEVGISVISQTGSLAPADKKIYALRDEINAVESIPLIASSIMSKKIASGAPNIVIDLKVGEGAFMKNVDDAIKLANYMIEIGKRFNRKVVCVLTDMNSPLGRTVGNGIEVKEAKEFFDGKCEERLYNLVLKVASYMVSIGKNITIEESLKEVKEVLKNGQARKKFYDWIQNQGGNLNKIKLSDKVITIKSNKEGYITKIDPLKIASLVKELGAGRTNKEDDIDLSVGIELQKSLYDYVRVDESLIKIYYNKEVPGIENKVEELIEIKSIIENKKDIIINVIE